MLGNDTSEGTVALFVRVFPLSAQADEPNCRRRRRVLTNEKTAPSQIIGGITGGVGQALLEEAITDPGNGRIANATVQAMPEAERGS